MTGPWESYVEMKRFGKKDWRKRTSSRSHTPDAEGLRQIENHVLIKLPYSASSCCEKKSAYSLQGVMSIIPPIFLF